MTDCSPCTEKASLVPHPNNAGPASPSSARGRRCRRRVAEVAVAFSMCLTTPQPASALTGIVVHSVKPNGGLGPIYNADKAIDESSTWPNFCAGRTDWCNLVIIATADTWESHNDFKTGVFTGDENDKWVPCLKEPNNKTLGDVARCNNKRIPKVLNYQGPVEDYLAQHIEDVKDHTNACLKFIDGGTRWTTPEYDLPSVFCVPIGGALSTCSFDTEKLSGSFSSVPGVLAGLKVSMGTVRVTCTGGDVRLVAKPDPATYPIKLEPSKLSTNNVATLDLGAGEGKPLAFSTKQNVPYAINVNAFVSGTYEAGTVSGSTTLVLSLP